MMISQWDGMDDDEISSATSDHETKPRDQVEGSVVRAGAGEFEEAQGAIVEAVSSAARTARMTATRSPCVTAAIKKAVCPR